MSRRRRRGGLAAPTVAAAVLALLLPACGLLPSDDGPAASGTPSPSAPSPSASAPSTGAASPDGPSSSPSPSVTVTTPAVPTAARARVRRVPQRQWDRIVAAGMAYEGCPITRPEQLRRVIVNHHTFDGGVARGTLVVNADVAASVARVFTRLFDEEFPIRRMRPLERYDGDSHRSLRDDNTASFNCRRPDQINAPQMASPHANGRAIDINPLENPWIDLRCQCWFPSAEFKERTPGPGKILKGGPVWRAFIDEGWIWQNIDVPDYMHFDTGYPSVAFDDPGPPDQR